MHAFTYAEEENDDGEATGEGGGGGNEGGGGGNEAGGEGVEDGGCEGGGGVGEGEGVEGGGGEGEGEDEGVAAGERGVASDPSATPSTTLIAAAAPVPTAAAPAAAPATLVPAARTELIAAAERAKVAAVAGAGGKKAAAKAGSAAVCQALRDALQSANDPRELLDAVACPRAVSTARRAFHERVTGRPPCSARAKLLAADGAPWPSGQPAPPEGYGLWALGLKGDDPVENALAQFIQRYAGQAIVRCLHRSDAPLVPFKPTEGDRQHRLCLLMCVTSSSNQSHPSSLLHSTLHLFRNVDGWKAIQEAAMAVDEAGLEQAAIVRAPGGVGWDDDMGRFGALVKTLRLCGVASLAGLPLPDPKSTRFDAMVKQMFDAATEQSAQLPLVPAQDAEPAALGTAAGSPPLQLQQQAPAPQLPAPQGSTVGEARAAAAGSAAGAPQPMEVDEARWSDLEAYRVRTGLDIFVVTDFAQKQLGVDPVELQQKLEANYPTRGAGDAIQPNVVQWVSGDNTALKYRGNTIPRTKIWLQRPPKEGGYHRYGYTGWQWNVLPATVSVEQCPEVLPLADRYDEWAAARGHPTANHYIVTRYSDGNDHIGWHSDKPRDIAPGSLITVVKTGAHGRPFEMCLPGKEKSPFFSEVLAPGTAVIMTLEANEATKHQVPVDNGAGPSGSIVFRTIETVVSHDQAVKELSKRPRASAPQPMEVEAPPAPAPTEAPPLLVPPSALHGLDLDGLVSQLKRVLAAAPLDEAMVGHVLDGLEGLRLSRQEMLDSGAPPPAAREPSVPEHLHRAHPPAQPPTLHPLTAPHRRVQAGQQAVQARSACSAQRARHRAVEAVDVGFGFRVLMPSVRGVRCACTACTLGCGVNECVHLRE